MAYRDLTVMLTVLVLLATGIFITWLVLRGIRSSKTGKRAVSLLLVDGASTILITCMLLIVGLVLAAIFTQMGGAP